MKIPYILAEIAQGYEGEPFLVKKFIEVAKEVGADGVKFQVFHPTELSIPSYKYHSLFEQLYIQPEKWIELIDYADSIGIDIWMDIFGVQTLEWVSKSKLKGIKIHATDIKNESLIRKVNELGRQVILGVGGSEMKEIEKASSLLSDCPQIIMLGFQAEPNEMIDIELYKIKLLKDRLGKTVGYADHIRVDTLSKYTVPVMSLVAGASVIEKHLTLEREYAKFEDYVSALNPEEFKNMVTTLKESVEIPDLFQQEFKLSPRELNYRKSSKKVILSSSDLKPGTVLKKEHFAFLRTGEEYSEILGEEDLLGREIKSPVKKHEIFKKNHFV